MTTKKQSPAMQYRNQAVRAFFPCELTPGSTIQIDEYTKGTGENTIVYCSTDDQPPLVCKVRCVHVIHDTTKIHYLVETDIEYNECERKTLGEDYHVFSIAYVNNIIERINAPVKYKWFNNRFTDSYVSKLLFALSPGTAFNLVKIIEYAKKQGVCRTPKGELPNVHVGKNKRFKKFIKQNINRFKSREFLHIKFVMEDVDDTHDLTTDYGDCDYVNYD